MKVRRIGRYKSMAVFGCRLVGFSHFAYWSTAWNKRLFVNQATKAAMRRASKEPK